MTDSSIARTCYHTCYMLHAYPQSTHHTSAITHLLVTIPTAAVDVKPLVIAYPTSLPPYQPAPPTPRGPSLSLCGHRLRQENDRRSARRLSPIMSLAELTSPGLPPYRYRTLDRNESPSGSSARVLVSALLQAFVSHPPSRASSPVPPHQALIR